MRTPSFGRLAGRGPGGGLAGAVATLGLFALAGVAFVAIPEPGAAASPLPSASPLPPASPVPSASAAGRGRAAGFEIVQNEVAIEGATATGGSASASCPAGATAVGGGAEFFGVPRGPGHGVVPLSTRGYTTTASGPVTDGAVATGWTATYEVGRHDPYVRGFRVTAICARP